jgi:hypothetical protein
MFGATVVYVDEKFMLILCDRESLPDDNGIWLATYREHHESLKAEFPRIRSVSAFGIAVTAWQVLSADDPDFEEMALRACQLIKAGDPRIGRIPKRRIAKKAKSTRGKRSIFAS